jgi:aryl-alcohol dehydrogenase-like predicted oxidoreductase
MQYKLLGRSGLRVSELCLGCATFGTNWGPIGSDYRESRRIFDAFAEAGGNFVDTSNRYQEGQSEEFLGEFLQRDRDRFVVATKFSLGDGNTPGTDPNGCGNHRKNMMRSVEGSLRRLQTDYIDLLWVHIWDLTTPIEETMRGLDDLVRQGKVHYVGASNFPAWWLARANSLAEFHGWSPLVATQVEYAITERSCEPEFLPFAHEMDVALVCWSPLGGGVCSGKYNREGGTEKLQRLAAEVAPEKRHFWHEVTRRNLEIMDRVVEIADRIGRTPAQVSLRWLMQQKVVCVPVFSARTVEQAREDLESVDFKLTDAEMRELTEASTAAVQSIMPAAGPYPYPMLEYGSPALPEFYSRFLLFGQTEDKIVNHRRLAPFQYQRSAAVTKALPIEVESSMPEFITV